MTKKIDNIKLLNGIRKQDEEIIGWIYDNWMPMVRQFIRKNSGSDSDVWDIFQDSLVVLFTRINKKEELNLTSDLKGYFFGIIKNIWYCHLHKNSKLQDIYCDFVDNFVNDEKPDYTLERILARAFQKLESDAQQILNLYIEGHTYSEIADKMNLKSETYARRKKYLSKLELISLIKKDPEYNDYLDQ